MSAREQGLRAIAIVEGAKGLLVLLAGFGILAVMHHGAQETADSLVRHLHLNPASHLPRVFLQAAHKADDGRLWLFAAGAAIYATLRLTQAWGLWNGQRWAEWFGVVTGSIYVPFEIYELWQHATAIRAGILVINLLVVAYLVWVLKTGRHAAA